MLGWLSAHNTGLFSVVAIEDAISQQIEKKLKCVFLNSKGRVIDDLYNGASTKRHGGN